MRCGQLAARIHRPEQPWQGAEEIRFTCDGFVICRRTLARTEIGDCLFQLAND